MLRDGVTVPQSVGIVHCVGSRDQQLQQLLLGDLLHADAQVRPPGQGAHRRQVYNFYIDIRTPAKAYDEFYQHILEEGILFVRGKVAEVTDAARLPGEEGKLIVQVEDTLVGKQRRIPVDMVILSAGLEPRHDAKEVGKMFGISCSADGWFIERHPKLDPVATMTDGIFIAGVCQGPKDIPASCVARGGGGRARAGPHPAEGRSALEPVRASVIDETVLRLPHLQQPCARSTRSPSCEDRQVTEINPALCQGCGTCVAACPAGAITGSHFSNEQIMAQIEGVLMLNLRRMAWRAA